MRHPTETERALLLIMLDAIGLPEILRVCAQYAGTNAQLSLQTADRIRSDLNRTAKDITTTWGIE